MFEEPPRLTLTFTVLGLEELFLKWQDSESDGSTTYAESDEESVKRNSEGLQVGDGIASRRSFAATRSAVDLEDEKVVGSSGDPNIVTWDAQDDPKNPKNWSPKRKWAATFVVSSFTLVSLVSSTVVAPSLPTIAAEFSIGSSIESQLVLSIFVLAYAIGPLFLAPMSELYGRVIVLQLANLFYLVFNTGCGFAQTKTQMLILRFLSGLGGSAPQAIGGGVISDVFEARQRGEAIGIYSLAPLLGPAIGPIAGGFITENTTWRWTFWATSIADGIIQFAGLFFLQETYAPKLLSCKCEDSKRATGNLHLRTQYDDPTMTVRKRLSTSLIRPLRMLGTQPIIQVLAVYMAYLYGLMYLVLSTFPTLWMDRYHQSIGIASLNFLSLGLGLFLGSQIAARTNDWIYGKLRDRHNGAGRPEFRVPLMVIGSILIPVGLFWYGWTAQFHWHWILPNIGITLFSAGTVICFQCIQAYLVDVYVRFAASAISVTTVLRSLAGFGFPLFAPAIYATLDYGWGNSVLAFIAIVLGVLAPFALWRWGQTLRARSPYAAGPEAN